MNATTASSGGGGGGKTIRAQIEEYQRCRKEKIIFLKSNEQHLGHHDNNRPGVCDNQQQHQQQQQQQSNFFINAHGLIDLSLAGRASSAAMNVFSIVDNLKCSSSDRNSPSDEAPPAKVRECAFIINFALNFNKLDLTEDYKRVEILFY
jgi:hypothetical protein